jgi:alkylhydroperoxidase/carboxymuconolactone decarboxylase family protein YurZ
MGWDMNVTAEEAFRRLTIGETSVLAGGLSVAGNRSATRLDGRTDALLRLAALVAVGAQPSSYRSVVQDATRHGARLDDLLGVLMAVADTVGTARVVAAAPAIALAAGYDVEAALEDHPRSAPTAS